MIIERNIEFRGSKGRLELHTLFDSGATYSCITPEKADELEMALSLSDPIDVETASEGNFLRITQATRLDFVLNGYRLTDEFMIVPGLSEEAIIGATTMQKWKIKLDFEHDDVIVDPRVAKLKLI